jgi:hypothetical protein
MFQCPLLRLSSNYKYNEIEGTAVRRNSVPQAVTDPLKHSYATTDSLNFYRVRYRGQLFQKLHFASVLKLSKFDFFDVCRRVLSKEKHITG